MPSTMSSPSRRSAVAQSLRRLVLPVAALTISLTVPVTKASAAIDVRIVNTQGQGVASRPSPSLSAPRSFGVPEGRVVRLHCHAWGDPVGARANRLWDYITYAGRSFYIPDVYTDSPTVANRPVAGIPFCGASAPPPPAPAVDRTMDGAARWAEARVGQVYADAAARQLLQRNNADGGWAPGPVAEWSGDCMRFAAAAWYSVGRTPTRGATAKAVADAYQRAGRLRGGSPPRGALVFYAWGNYGHVGIAVGGDQVVSTTGVDGDRRANRRHGLHAIGLTYRGYVDPR